MEKGGDGVGGARGGGAVPYARWRTPAPTVSCFLVFQSPNLGLLPCHCFIALFKNHRSASYYADRTGQENACLRTFRRRNKLYVLSHVSESGCL